MAYSAATAETLKAAFPKFTAVADETVEYWLTRALRGVDDSWAEDDRQMGEMLLAAHYLTLEGYGAGAEAEIASGGLAGMQSVRSGNFSFTKAEAGSKAKPGSIESTSYGQRYLELLTQNKGGARVTPTGIVPQYSLYEGPYFYSGG